MSERSPYDAYALAGELFERLNTELPFGELIMQVNSQGFVRYRWDTKARGRRYTMTYTAVLLRLQEECSLPSLAWSLADKWKAGLRKLDKENA